MPGSGVQVVEWLTARCIICIDNFMDVLSCHIELENGKNMHGFSVRNDNSKY